MSGFASGNFNWQGILAAVTVPVVDSNGLLRQLPPTLVGAYRPIELYGLRVAVDNEQSKTDSDLAQQTAAIAEANTELKHQIGEIEKNTYEIWRKQGVVGNYNLISGKGVDASPAIQSLVSYCDKNRIASLHLPTILENYLLDKPVVIREPGIRFYGDRGGCYMRGTKKNGNIVIGLATHGIELVGIGPDDDFQNIADMWNISGLGFTHAEGQTFGTKSGIFIDRQTNGPDRGYVFERISGTGLFAVVHQAPKRDGVSIAGANWYISGGNMSGNKYGIFSAAPIYGLVFTNMQAEQNEQGAIHGDFQGGVAIEDNMLEGQPNVVNLTATQSSIQLSMKRNYFESNEISGSLYVVQLSTDHLYDSSRAEIGPNVFSGVGMPEGFATITGRGKWDIQMHDPYPVTFKLWAGSVLRGSKLFNKEIDYFRLGGLLDTVKTPEISLGNSVPMDASGGRLSSAAVVVGGTEYVDQQVVTLNSNDGTGYGALGVVSVIAGAITSITIDSPGYGYTTGDLIAVDGGNGICTATATDREWTHVQFASGLRTPSQFGSLLARNAQAISAIPLAAAEGDLIVISALIMVKDKSVDQTMYLQILDARGNYVVDLGPSDAHELSGGEWTVICMPFVMPSAQASIGFRYYMPRGSVNAFCAGACARNYGAYTNDGTQLIDIHPVMPRV